MNTTIIHYNEYTVKDHNTCNTYQNHNEHQMFIRSEGAPSAQLSKFKIKKLSGIVPTSGMLDEPQEDEITTVMAQNNATNSLMTIIFFKLASI